ncbi:MAG: cytochrome c3 family protein [Holophagales bacterium]|nr:MAG: cytochrome c3 family protein [Holophagales bacterium]
MPHPEPSRARLLLPVTAAIVALTFASGAGAQRAANVQNTRHNLSVSGPGTVKALTEDRICVFCHTPHNSTPQAPLWNRGLEPQTYSVYWSPTLKAAPLPQPSGPTKLCLSCHDGTIALGTVVNPAAGIAMSGGGVIPPASASMFGLDLSGHHPVSFPYHTALPNANLVSPPPPVLSYGAADEIHCITCHDPHDDQFGKFLVMDNQASALCLTCHHFTRWPTATHAVSTVSLLGAQLPAGLARSAVSPRLADLACEACHTSHAAATPASLLRFTDRRPEPYSCTTTGCHSGGGSGTASAAPGAEGSAKTDIGRQVRKGSAHREWVGDALPAPGTGVGEPSTTLAGVACQSCHDPHAANRRAATLPYASGLLDDVPGVDRSGLRVASVTYEYELCFRCHANASGDREVVPRVVASTNTRLDFDPSNVSYHPVVAMGRNLDVPSIPSALSPGMAPSQIVGCTSCHADDEGGSRGPHGSDYAPILRERYDLSGNVGESFEMYALCYRCHDRGAILRNASFRAKTQHTTLSGGGHRGHLQAGISCATCHDPHGVPAEGAGADPESGDHRHLINFDLRIVQPLPGQRYPVFQSTGLFSGSCTLTCHGVTHDRATASYP